MQNDRTPAPPARAMLYFALSEPDSSRPMPCVPVPYNKMATPNTTSTKLNVECTIPRPQYATKRKIRPSKMKKMPLCVNAAHPVKGGGGDAGAAFPMAFRISSRISDLNASRPAWKSAAESGRGSGEGGGAGARSGGRGCGGTTPNHTPPNIFFSPLLLYKKKKKKEVDTRKRQQSRRNTFKQQ